MRLVRIFNIHGHISCKIPVKIWHFIASILSITCSLNSVPRHCLHPLPQSHSRAKWDQSILSTKKKIEVEKKRRISFENHYFWKSNNLRNCSELVVSLVFELLKILIFIEDTTFFRLSLHCFSDLFKNLVVISFDTRLSRDFHKKIRQKSNFEIFEKRPKKSRKLPSMVTIHHHKHDCTCVHKNFPPFLRKKVKKIRQKSNFEIFEKRPKISRKLPSMVTIHHHKHDCTCVHKKTAPFLRKKVKKFAKNPLLRFLKTTTSSKLWRWRFQKG